jgi:hypothetical protein
METKTNNAQTTESHIFPLREHNAEIRTKKIRNN